MTAALIDLKLVTKEDTHMIVGPCKIQRARAKIMEKERGEAMEKLKDEKIECIFL